MRDPERIDRLLLKLGALWKKYPDMRLGQLVVNVHVYTPPNDIYFVEDDKMETALD